VPTFHFSYESYLNTNRPYLRIEELASRVAELTGTEVRESPGCVDVLPGENPAQALSCAQTRWQIGWQPSRGFEQALSELVEFLRLSNRSERVQFICDAADAAAERLEVGAGELSTV